LKSLRQDHLASEEDVAALPDEESSGTSGWKGLGARVKAATGGSAGVAGNGAMVGRGRGVH